MLSNIAAQHCAKGEINMTQEQAASPLFSANDLKKLILPLIAEQFLAVTVGMADTVMVSSVGEAAVSGISIVDQINTLLIQVFAALATGGAVVASQYLGRRERNHAVESAKQLYYVTLLLSLLIGVVCVVTNRGLLSFIYGRVEPDVMENAATYFWLSALSYPFIALYNAGAALFRSMGNSKVSLYASLGMNVINIGGNALLIYGLHWVLRVRRPRACFRASRRRPWLRCFCSIPATPSIFTSCINPHFTQEW